jgi:PadR family transcriptional regulator PadR
MGRGQPRPAVPFRMTLPTQLVLRTLLESPLDERYGLDLSRAAGLATGTIHPILARLEAVGWLESRWEDVDPREEGRPRRRYYWLTEDGVERARDALARTHTPINKLPGLRRGLAGGKA